MGKLTAISLKSAKPGVHGDGKGLCLRVKPSGAKSWVLRVQFNGRRQDIGLGSFDILTLAEAREKAAALRKLARQGVDAVAERDKIKVKIPTFAEAVDLAHLELAKGWSEKTGIAFKASLQGHAVPAIGARRIDQVTTQDVIAALSKIWTEKPQQARKVRHRILQVLTFAKSRGWRSEPVPLASELRQGLAKQPRAGNFAAVPFAEIPALVGGELAKAETSARLALLFTIFTAARSGEVRLARWEQIDLGARTWTRPAEAMKAGVAHTVTLNEPAVQLLERAAALWGGAGLIFPSARAERPLSDMTLSKALRAAGRAETVHGFRSAFRDWAAERMATVPAMVAEMALAHAVGSKTEQAYLRSDLREMRTRLMDAWGRFAAPNFAFVSLTIGRTATLSTVMEA